MTPEQIKSKAHKWFNSTPTGEMAKIVLSVSKRSGIPASDIIGPSRKQPIFDARAYAMALCRSKGFSYPQIGHHFSRDHATVIYAVRKVLQ